MKLSKIYSNYPNKFRTIRFRDGLNVILGHVQDADNRAKDTHNLGKTLFGQIIDFCLMRTRDPEFFLFAYPQFEDFVFFLEIRLQSGGYLTIRRSVREASKGAFKRHAVGNQNFTELPADEWDHWNQPFNTAKDILDGILDLTVLRPWSYRQAVAYSLRSQRDFDEPFKLAKFAGNHADWKPFLAQILGFDGMIVAAGYTLEDEIARLKGEEKQLLARASGISDPDQLRGQIEIVEGEATILESELDRFDFSPEDRRVTRELVSNIDSEIVQLNAARYSLDSDRARIQSAIGVRLSINLKSLQKIYAEAKIYFGEQVTKDFTALERFNAQLAEERDEYLRQDLAEIERQLAMLEDQLTGLGDRRAALIASLTDPESLSKYKRLTKDLVGRQADLETLKRLQSVLADLAAVRGRIKGKEKDLEAVTATLEDAVSLPSERYAAIRGFFDKIVKHVVDQHANLFSRVNSAGHLEFDVQILNDAAKPTGAADGFSYGRLLCIAFDLAIMRAYLAEPFPHFVFHDGILETLDDRKKLNLIDVIRQYARIGVQHIVTVIDSELPIDATGRRFTFDNDEVILTLTDDGDSGRLFKMSAW